MGLGLVLSAAILAHGTDGREVAALLFVLITSPVGAHMLSKAMYQTGYRPWKTPVASRRRPRSQPRR